MLNSEHRIAILLHNGILGPKGKTGLTMLRYSRKNIVAVIDRECAGRQLKECAGIDREVPVVGSLQEALNYRPDVLVIGAAPSGGLLPPDWMQEVKSALKCGMSLVNGLHTRLSKAPELMACLRDGQWIWDVRSEPEGLGVARGDAAGLSCLRVLTVGTDMAIGKKCAAIEMNELALRRGLRSRFLATGQSGIMISGEGVPIDSVRIDYAASAIEQMVLRAGKESDILFLEGQGSILHPGSSATLPLIRGMQPTHLILVHRAGQSSLFGFPDKKIPPLTKVARLYEEVAGAAGVLCPSKVAAIALNTFGLTETHASEIIAEIGAETGLPCTDPVRCGAKALLDSVLY